MTSPHDFSEMDLIDRVTATALLDRLDEITFNRSPDGWLLPAPVASPRRHPRAKWVALASAAACLAMALVLVQGTSRHLPPLLAAPPVWAAVPANATPAQTKAITTACQKLSSALHMGGMPDMPVTLPPLIARDLRGTGATGFFSRGVDTIACMATRSVGSMSSDGAGWIALWASPFPPASRPEGSQAIVLDALGTGAISAFDNSIASGHKTLTEYTTAMGRAPATTDKVIVSLPRGRVATATLVNGQFAIWWPAVAADFYEVRFTAVGADGQPLATLIETSPWWNGHVTGWAPNPQGG
jgi:hypothetical protein